MIRIFLQPVPATSLMPAKKNQAAADRLRTRERLRRSVMAEGTGLEPAYPCGRRFSRPLHYHYATPPRLRSVEDYISGSLRPQPWPELQLTSKPQYSR